MRIKGITDEDFVNYKIPSMFISTSVCSFKCDNECGRPICQNGPLASQPSIDVSIDRLVERYTSNPITRAVVLGGLEPIDQYEDICSLIESIRANCNDDVVIYTGYTKDELREMKMLDKLKSFGNIVLKYGRFIPDQNPHFDPILGIDLASDNQYAERFD